MKARAVVILLIPFLSSCEEKKKTIPEKSQLSRDTQELNSAVALMERDQAEAIKNQKLCASQLALFREKLSNQPEELKILNEFARLREEAILLEIQLIGSSWGGSGAKVAYPQAKAAAHLNYYNALQNLGTSLHLQN